jgi:hypothetical protein
VQTRKQPSMSQHNMVVRSLFEADAPKTNLFRGSANEKKIVRGSSDSNNMVL